MNLIEMDRMMFCLFIEIVKLSIPEHIQVHVIYR